MGRADQRTNQLAPLGSTRNIAGIMGLKEDRLSKYKKPYAFLSSLYWEHKELRARLYELGQEAGRPIYVDEQIFQRDLEKQEPLEIADHLIRTIRDANIFICVLGAQHHGSPIRVDGRPTSVSFFEIELFQAAILKKPIYIFVLRDFEPKKQLRGLLEILRGALPDWSVQLEKSESDVMDDVQRLIEHPQRTIKNESIHNRPTLLQRLVQRLYVMRGRANNHGKYVPLLFLNNQYEVRGIMPDEALIRDLFRKASKKPDEQQKLSRLWIAMRELMSASYDKEEHAAFRPLWNHALGRWASAGAWYGLHGHIYMGCLAALNSMARVRETMRASAQPSTYPRDLEHPGGPLASALYSIGKRMYDKEDRKALLAQAVEEVQGSISRHGDDAGLFAIRGSIFREMCNLSQAIEDYELVLRLREEAGADEGAIGEALSELGFAYVLSKRFIKGRDYLIQGVNLMRGRQRVGFIVRAKKKLALAYLLTGHPLKAYQERLEARALAKYASVFDQL